MDFFLLTFCKINGNKVLSIQVFQTNTLTIYFRFPSFRKSHNTRALMQKFSHHFNLMSPNFVELLIVRFLANFLSNGWKFWIKSKYLFWLVNYIVFPAILRIDSFWRIFFDWEYTMLESDRYWSYNWSVWKPQIKYLKCRPLSINIFTLQR